MRSGVWHGQTRWRDLMVFGVTLATVRCWVSESEFKLLGCLSDLWESHFLWRSSSVRDFSSCLTAVPSSPLPSLSSSPGVFVVFYPHLVQEGPKPKLLFVKARLWCLTSCFLLPLYSGFLFTAHQRESLSQTSASLQSPFFHFNQSFIHLVFFYSVFYPSVSLTSAVFLLV